MLDSPYALELIRLNTEISSRVRPDGDLEPILGTGATLFQVYQHAHGIIRRIRHGLPAAARERLWRLPPEIALREHDVVKHILSRYVVCDRVFAGRACYFAGAPAPSEYPDVVMYKGCHAVLVAGDPVSWAWTQAGSDRADELAVETLAEYQGRGYGRQAAAAWAAHVMAEGRVAFYSHDIDNPGSERLARSLSVVQYAVCVSYS